jgi:hypothetical protein
LNDLLENMITTIENKRIEMINNNSIWNHIYYLNISE